MCPIRRVGGSGDGSGTRSGNGATSSVGSRSGRACAAGRRPTADRATWQRWVAGRDRHGCRWPQSLRDVPLVLAAHSSSRARWIGFSCAWEAASAHSSNNACHGRTEPCCVITKASATRRESLGDGVRETAVREQRRSGFEMVIANSSSGRSLLDDPGRVGSGGGADRAAGRRRRAQRRDLRAARGLEADGGQLAQPLPRRRDRRVG